MHTVVETGAFVAHARDAGVTKRERRGIIDVVANDPEAGEVMQGTGGARKLRFAREGKGKSGSYRVITYFGGKDVPVFLLDVFGKGDKVNLTKAERNQLAKVLASIADAYRASTITTAATMKRKGSDVA